MVKLLRQLQVINLLIKLIINKYKYIYRFVKGNLY